MRQPDLLVLDYVRQNGRFVLTRNCDDFLNLHRFNPNHPGILAIYQSPEPSKNMSYKTIISAINNLETSGYVLINQLIVLNQWQ